MSKINEAIIIVSSWVELSILVKVTIMLVLGLTLVWLFRNARASVRHLLLVATFAALLLLPLIVVIVPAMTIAVPVNYTVTSITEFSAVSASQNLTTNIGSNLEQKTLKSGDRSAMSLATIVRLGWAAGFFLLFVSLVINLGRLRRLRRNGLPWPELDDYMKSLASECGIRRKVEILLHEDIKIPLTCGIGHPAILLPPDARRWSEADLRRVLVHELEHIKRGDWFIQLAARTTYAIYWFHPLIWIAWRRLCLEAERACDDAVIQRAESIEYADQLVLLAQRLSKPSALPTLGMANRSDLSIRLSAILDGRQRRGRAGLLAVVSIAFAAGSLVLAIAPLQAVLRPSVPRASSSVTTEIREYSPEDNSADSPVGEISQDPGQGRIVYERKVNNSPRIKRLSVGGYKSRPGTPGKIKTEKLQAEKDAGKLQPEKQRTDTKIVRAEPITKRQKTDAERRKGWAELETKRTAEINKRLKIDAEYRKQLADMEAERLKIDAEYRKRLAKMQGIEDKAIARQAGIIPE